MNTDSEIIDLDKIFKDLPGDDSSPFTSSDEEELNQVDFSENELRMLCNRDCYVDLTRRNLYYEYEKNFRKGLAKKCEEFNPDLHNDVFYKKLQKNFRKLYSKHYLTWEKRHESFKPRRFRQNMREAIKFLNINKEDIGICVLSEETSALLNTDEELSDSEKSSQTVIRKVERVVPFRRSPYKDNNINENQSRGSSYDSIEDFLHNSMNDHVGSRTTATNRNQEHETPEISYSEFSIDVRRFAIIHSQPITSTQNQCAESEI